MVAMVARPPYHIPQSQLEALIESRFTYEKIATGFWLPVYYTDTAILGQRFMIFSRMQISSFRAIFLGKNNIAFSECI